MSGSFLISPTVILRCEPQYYDSYVAFDYERVKTEFLEEEEFRALKYIQDKSAGTEEICKASGMEYKCCENFLNRMMKLGYVIETAHYREVKSQVRVKINPNLYKAFLIPFLSAPTSVDIFITNRCNLRCVHCFSSSGEGEPKDLSADDLRSIFDQLEEMGVFEVRINGGEPLLHPEIDEVFTELKGRRFRKVLLTNGTLLDEETIFLMKEFKITPTLSLDDSVAEEHDIFRGIKGTFKRTINALHLLKKNNVQYGINSCLHKRNLNRYEDIVKLAIKNGAYRVAFLDLKVTGRMRRNIDWVPSYSEYQKVALNLLATKFKYKRWIDISLDVFLHCRPLKESVWEAKRGYISCQAGKNRLSIDSDGSVYPCNLVLSDPQWRMGNIKNESLRDVWFSDKWLFFRGGVKITDLKKCSGCKNLKKCTDFYCRLLPYLTSKDPYAPHPKCLEES